ncbi:MAG: hypothetical protein ACQEXX_24625 [Bacillota bacterium]
MFLMADIGEIMGSKMHVEGFKQWRLPQWFRVKQAGILLLASLTEMRRSMFFVLHKSMNLNLSI